MSSPTSDSQETKVASSHRSRKFINVTVYFLDDSSHVFQLQAKSLGQALFEKVCKFINVLEVDYFGLEFEDDKKIKCWLDALKPLCSQVTTSFPTMYFCVKFYTPDPVQLEDEFTRYLFGLQVKKKKILQMITGQTPAEADLNLLETARRCELYGVKMTAAKDHEGVPLNLAVAHLGLLQRHCEFFFEGRNECKNFWKKCIENHTFFRCTDAKQGMRQKPKIFSRGSSFRYSGRTQKQVSEFVRENCFKRQPFQRSTSLRTPSSPSRSIGTSISPQPLLPSSTTPSVKTALGCQTPLSQVQYPPDGDYGHEYYSQDTDDNISHDSYNVLDKESATKTNTECLSTNIANTSNSKDQDMESSATKNDGGKSNDEYEDDDYRRKSRRHHRPETLCKAYPRTVDFVYVNQLPAVGSFSYRDDSVELKSPGKLKLEMLRQKLKDEDFSSCIVNGSDFRARSKSQPLLPLGVDLLNDLVHVNNLSQKPSCSRDFNHKESAMKVIADNLDVKKNKPSIIQNADVLPSTSNQVTSIPPDCIPKKKEPEITTERLHLSP
ncbi:FERM, ARHGEF and pleckstrin domain-containing protein 1 [Caerostris extrusa]|uniref:FERM, ARHGEF and pleckstrin domain-containing protein 1 n=1 Tax=Caerostris extrusa TaxID=172846 RepID=A0AAV4SZE6_CAEEX|nr:FERM, ARHGEF and pleckstrin domain-containing protein 1 [Caerostris extrusa]